MKQPIKFFATLRDFGHNIALNIGQQLTDNRFAVAQPILMDAHDVDSMYPDAPALSLTQDEAQQLMDELFRIGIRPSDGSGSAGQMAATEKHLEDMRRLVFSRVP